MTHIIGEPPKGNIVNLEEHDCTKWVFGIAFCEMCRKVWLSQAHVKANVKALECPNCKRFRSYFIPQEMIKQLFDVEVER